MLIKDSALYFKPNKFFNCAEAIIRAAADVNPDITGVETKLTTNPETFFKVNSFLMIL